MEDQLIDNEENSPPKYSTWDIIRWWEKKRLLFNLLMISIVAVVVTIYMLGNSHGHFLLGKDFVVRSIEYFIFINVCYCAGWGLQLVIYHGFETHYSTTTLLNILLFVIGTSFTGLVTSTGYSSYLGLSKYF